MRILHILDHSIPLHSGYAFRTLAILRQQRALGWHTIHLTGPKQGGLAGHDCNGEGWHFFRTAPSHSSWARLPVLQHMSVVSAIAQRLRHVVKLTRPDVLHAHSPSLNAIAAQLVEVETIERDEFEKILIANGITPKKKEDIEHQPLA